MSDDIFLKKLLEDINETPEDDFDVEEDFSSENEDPEVSTDQNSSEFNAKKISDMILKNIMEKDPEKIKRFNKTTLETDASRGFNFGITPSEYEDFTNYYINILNEEVDGRMPRETQLRILKDASQNKKPAVIYLYCRYLRLIARAYEHYYVNFIKKGNPTLDKSDIRSEESVADTRIKAFELLGNVASTASAYKTFKPEKYDENANLLDHFGYWLSHGYLEAAIIRLAKQYDNGGLTGGREEGDDTRVDSLDDKMESNRYNEPSTADDSEKVHNIMILDQIEQVLKDYGNEKLIKMFSLMRQGYSIKDAAAEMQISPAYADRLLQRTRKVIQDSMGNPLNEKASKVLNDLFKLNN